MPFGLIKLGAKAGERASEGAKAFAKAAKENVKTMGKIASRHVSTVAEAGAEYVQGMKDDPLQTLLTGGATGKLSKKAANNLKEDLKDIYNITIKNNPTIKAGEAMVKNKK